MSLYPPKSYPQPKGLTEFEILKASHKFLRSDSEDEHGDDGPDKNGANDPQDPSKSVIKKQKQRTWEEELAAKYYSSLYREFAVCDLKHYKSGNFALRWRTETEVLSGAGETTCGNTRCKYHSPPNPSLVSPFDLEEKSRRKKGKQKGAPALTTLELPFAYEEHGEQKMALVKVVLCPRCVDKLMWKRRKDRERQKKEESERGGTRSGNEVSEHEEGLKGADEKSERPISEKMVRKENEKMSGSKERKRDRDREGRRKGRKRRRVKDSSDSDSDVYTSEGAEARERHRPKRRRSRSHSPRSSSHHSSHRHLTQHSRSHPRKVE